MNTEVGRNLLWNETKVCSLWEKKKGVRQPPGLGLLSLGISIQWPILCSECMQWYGFGDVSHRVRGVWDGFLVQPSLAGHTWISGHNTLCAPDCSWTACCRDKGGPDPSVVTCCLIIHPEWGARINRYPLHNVDMFPVCHSYLDRVEGWDIDQLPCTLSLSCVKWVILFYFIFFARNWLSLPRIRSNYLILL